MSLLETPLSTRKKIQVALAGLGEHAQRNILPAMEKAESLKLEAIWTRHQERGQECARRYGARYVADYASLLKDESIDVIYIALPNSLHFEYGMEALKASKHLWCEKPITLAYQQTEILLHYARERGLAVCESVVFPYHAQFKALKNLLAQNVVGELKTLYARFGFPHRKREDIRYQSSLGGGAFWDCACYPLTASLSLCGDTWKHMSMHRLSEEGYDVDTSGSAYLLSSSDCAVHLDWGFGRSYVNEIEAWGSLGRLRLERAFSKTPTLVTKIQYLGFANGDRELLIEPEDAFVSMLEDFSRACFLDSEREKQGQNIERLAHLMHQAML